MKRDLSQAEIDRSMAFGDGLLAAAGMSVTDPATRADAELALRGEITFDEAIDRAAIRVTGIDQALAVLGRARADVSIPDEHLDAILTEAIEIATEVDWTMSLEAQDLAPGTTEEIVVRLVAKKIAELL